MSKEKAIKHIKTIKSYITCIHEDLSEGKKINPFGLAYKFAIQECDKALKELEDLYDKRKTYRKGQRVREKERKNHLEAK